MMRNWYGSPGCTPSANFAMGRGAPEASDDTVNVLFVSASCVSPQSTRTGLASGNDAAGVSIRVQS